MSCIVCATRGGEGSRAVQEEAIHLARERNVKLVFLFVVDLGDLHPTDEGLVPYIQAELHWLGQALVYLARKRARLENIQADVIIRQGNVQEEIGRFLQESKAELLLLGAPRGTTAAIFGDDAVELFAKDIQAQTNVPVRVVRPESQSEFRPNKRLV
jgi:nucleotide-binding universal stress UspA family protein